MSTSHFRRAPPPPTQAPSPAIPTYTQPPTYTQTPTYTQPPIYSPPPVYPQPAYPVASPYPTSPNPYSSPSPIPSPTPSPTPTPTPSPNPHLSYHAASPYLLPPAPIYSPPPPPPSSQPQPQPPPSHPPSYPSPHTPPPPVSAPSAPPRPPKPAPAPPAALLNPWQLTEAQRQEQASSAAVDLEASRSALADLREAEAMAIASAEALQEQGEQIDRMHQATIEMSAQLTHADRLVKGIGSWKHTITNTFTDVDDTVASQGNRGGHRDAQGNVVRQQGDELEGDGPATPLLGRDRPPPVRREFKPTARGADAAPVEEVVLEERIHAWGPRKRQEDSALPAGAPGSRIPKEWTKKPAAKAGTVGLSANATREQRIAFEAQQMHLEEMVQILDNLGEINVYVGDATEAQTEQLERLNLDSECVQFQLERTNERIQKIID